jgi:hypothetical protein
MVARRFALEMLKAEACGIRNRDDGIDTHEISQLRTEKLVCSAGAVMTFDLARRADERFKATMMQMLRPSRRLPNSVEPEVTRRAAQVAYSPEMSFPV